MTQSEAFKPANVLLVEDNDDDIELMLEALKDSKIRIAIDTRGVLASAGQASK